MCELHPSSISASVYAVQQFGCRCQTNPGPVDKKGVPMQLLGMKGDEPTGGWEASGALGAPSIYLGVWAGPLGGQCPVKNKLRNWPSRWRLEKPLRETEQNEWDMSGVGLFVDTRPP